MYRRVAPRLVQTTLIILAGLLLACDLGSTNAGDEISPTASAARVTLVG